MRHDDVIVAWVIPVLATTTSNTDRRRRFGLPAGGRSASEVRQLRLDDMESTPVGGLPGTVGTFADGHPADQVFAASPRHVQRQVEIERR